ncbi:GntR family transcriptional regulator [Alicyclobacillus vulcanalis]|uniref:Transcriptional regulator, GntR family n=1 Tax=Alicyclobacillus vulcanalis TaxID=252246 RepID=A0A1N7NNK5_9BACL|nr:GntR family transcriptional regulator [Alicyclobacillus vulcanalis]SIS99860.1 transcriptional regulator, GntR family [Alicyclobacillus vulcanalis]
MERGPEGVQRLGDAIADVLRYEIVMGECAAGHVLSENFLARRFGTSRSPVREALRQLAHEGLLELGRNGARVLGLSGEDVQELYDVRELVEGFAARRACRLARGQREGLAQTLLSVARDMEDAVMHGDWHRFSELDLVYHQSIVEAANHRRIMRLWHEIGKLLQLTLAIVIRMRMQRGEADMRGALAQHRALAEALLAGDEEWMARVVQSHVDESRRLLLSNARLEGSRGEEDERC